MSNAACLGSMGEAYSRLVRGRDKVSIEFGPGLQRAVPGAITIDHLPIPTADLVANVDDGIAFIPDDSVDLIFSSHFMEHVKDPTAVMREFHRVLKPGGELHTVVPHFSNPYYYSDPTHRTPWGLYSMFYFSKETFYRRTVPAFYNDIDFKVTDIRLIFGSPFKWRRMFKRDVMERIFNMNRYMQELFEEQFCNMIPCYEMDIRMRKR